MYIIYSLYYYTVCGKDTAVVVLVSCGEFLDFCGKSAPKLAYLYTIFICFFVDKPTLFWSILKKTAFCNVAILQSHYRFNDPSWHAWLQFLQVFLLLVGLWIFVWQLLYEKQSSKGFTL